MRHLNRSQYSLRKSLCQGKRLDPVLKASVISSRVMGRTVKDEKVKTGVKRTRGRPRTKESKPTTATKRRKPCIAGSINGTKSPKSESSLSPTHQEPPQLELMPPVDEDDDISIPIGFSSLISVDDHLCPGKCIVICPIANCRKRFSNPIEFVSHLRIYHENDTLSSVKIFTCPICLKTHFSSHTTSSDLILLSEHAARYHGQTLKQAEFIYFCTIVLDVAADGKATQIEKNNRIKKEAGCLIQQPNLDNQYLSILPLAPNSATGEMRSHVSSAKVARVTTDSLGLRMPSSAGHFIQISPMSQRLADNSVNATVACSTAPQPVFAALAAVADQLSAGGAPTLLLSSNPSCNTAATTTTPSEQSILIAPTGGICVASSPVKSLPVLIASSSTSQSHASDTNQENISIPTLQPQSSSAAAALVTLKQLMQSASAAVKSHQSPPVVAMGSSVTTLTPAVVSSPANTFLSTIPSAQVTTGQSRNICAAKVVTKVEPSSAVTPLAYPFVQGSNAAVSSEAEFDSNSDLSCFTSASADLLTLARLSVNQASVEAINSSSTSSNNSNQESTPPPLLPLPSQPSQSSPALRNRRLLPRKTTLTTASTSAANPAPLRKRVALPPLAVKPPKKLTTPIGNVLTQSASTQQPQISAHLPLVSSGSGVNGVAASEEAPVITAALINPSCPSPTTATLIPSSLGNVLAKSRLLQASVQPSTYISVQPRPTPLSSVPSMSNQHQQHSYQQQPQHLIQRAMPISRPAPLQKILPRPNTTVTPVTTTPATTPVTPTNSAAGGAKKMRPLLYSVPAPLIAQTPLTVPANTAVMAPTGSAVVSPANTPTKVSTAVYISQVNRNGAVVATVSSTTPAAAAVNKITSSDDGSSALIICTSPSELNIST